MSTEFNRLLTIMNDLREKCPWDKKQTLESLSHLTIEEVYELYDAILENNLDNLKEEIADIMLHLVFYAKIINEKDGTSIEDILKKGNDKLISRHPHVYETTKDLSVEQVKENWENLKLKEGRKSILGGVPKSLPALVKAHRIQDKAAHVGFQWDEVKGVLDKLDEEISELKTSIQSGDQQDIEEEMGDVLFSMINLARYIKVDPELALQRTNQKFIQRFQYIEDHADKPLSDMTLEEMDKLWNEAKGEKSE
jgi:XTP/dITP diphosphohydrolase